MAQSVLSLGTLILSLVLAAAWLLPNHYRPWPAFHADAWVAVSLALLVWLRLAFSRGALQISRLCGVCLFVSLVPMLQWGVGQIPLAGDALVSSAYLLGFALAVALGENWARQAPHEPLTFLFLPVALAGLVSVGIQLDQWSGGTESDTALDIWVMYVPPGMRPFANLGQPNQLATLLLWGLIAVAWGWYRRALQGWMVASAGSLLVLGLALTQSRTGWLSFFVLVALACAWRKREFGRQLLWAAAGLYALYLVLLVALPLLADALGLASATSMAERLRSGLSTEIRLQAWRMFLDASWQRPWFGYGWGHTREAMLAVIAEHEAVWGVQFAQAHMLPLDVVLWVGWPFGVAIVALMAWWLAVQWRCAQTVPQALALAALLVVGIHAMLELPLHYAYFLLPAGILIGTLNAQAPPLPVLRCLSVARFWAAAVVFGASMLLALIVRDYFLVERAFVEMRLESQRVGTVFNRQPPDTWLLRQWHDFVVLSRTDPKTGMTEQEIAQWRALTIYFPALHVVDKYMQALDLNGHRDELADFRGRLCGIMSRDLCEAMQRRWALARPKEDGAASVAASPPKAANQDQLLPARK